MLTATFKTSGKKLKNFFVGEDSMTYAKTWLWRQKKPKKRLAKTGIGTIF